MSPPQGPPAEPGGQGQPQGPVCRGRPSMTREAPEPRALSDATALKRQHGTARSVLEKA